MLVARSPGQTVKITILAGSAEDDLGYAIIDLRLKVHEGHHCLLAANSPNAEMKALLEVPDRAGEDSVHSFDWE